MLVSYLCHRNNFDQWPLDKIIKILQTELMAWSNTIISTDNIFQEMSRKIISHEWVPSIYHDFVNNIVLLSAMSEKFGT